MADSNKIIIKEASIESAVKVHKTIPEFDKPADAAYFRERYKGKLHVIFVAYLDEEPIGYMIAYDKFEDGSIYCWMTGVNPEFRKLGVLKKLMENLESWCVKKNLHTIHIKTRNRRRAMLNYLINNGYNITEVISERNVEDYQLFLKKKIK